MLNINRVKKLAGAFCDVGKQGIMARYEIDHGSWDRGRGEADTRHHGRRGDNR